MAKLKRKIVTLEHQSSKLSSRLSKKQKVAINQLRFNLETKVIEVAALQQANAASSLLLTKKAELFNYVKEQFENLTKAQQEQITGLLTNVYNNTRVEVSAALGKTFDVTNDFQLNNLLNRVDKNLNLSQRIWHNNNTISERVNRDISRLLYNNANPTDIKRALMADYNVSYNSADRLIRTETSKFYNSAAVDSYRDAGIKEVEFLAEADACEEHCQPNDGKTFPIGTGPIPPLHPHCRCTILPVIKD